MIVIGGDDNYKDEDEEDREFISRWAKRKISSQFTEEFLDGRKSFIFSWDKEHRKIHEKALVHFFDPNKKGQKFEYHPPPRKAVTKPGTPPRQREVDPATNSRHSKETKSSFYEQKDRSYKIGGNSGSQGAGPQRATGSTMVPNPLNSRPQEKLSSMIGTPREKGPEFSAGGTVRPNIQSQEDKPWATTSLTKPPQEPMESLALLGCCLSEKAIHAVNQVLKSIGPKLNLHSQPSVMNLSTAKQVKQYLERHSLQFCVLVVDGETVKDAYENLPARKDEYEELLKTAVEKVATRVVILVCGSLSLPKEDEEIIHQTIYRTVKEKGKGFMAWLKDGILSVDTDVLAQLLSPNFTMSFVMSASSPQGVAQGETNLPSHSYDQRRHVEQPPGRKPGYGWENENMQQQRVSLPAAATPTYVYNTINNSVKGKLVLKSKLRYGNISLESADLETLCEEFWEIPDEIAQGFQKTHKHIDEKQVKILSVPIHNSHLVYIGDLGIEMADNDLLLLKTRVNNGLVSFHASDIEVRYPEDWQVPENILEDLKKNGSNGKLFIILDEKGTLKCTVKKAVKDRVAGAVAFFTSKIKSSSKTKFA